MRMHLQFEALGHQTPQADLEALRDLAHDLAIRQRARTGGPLLAVEVGSWTGRTALVLAPHCDRLYCVDHWLGNPDDHLGGLAAYYGRDRLLGAFARNMGDAFLRSVIPLVGPSRLWADAWPEAMPVDLVFIDGAHGYTDVCADILGWRPHVRAGGLIVLHDHGVGFPGVDRAVVDLLPGAAAAGLSLAVGEVR